MAMIRAFIALPTDDALRATVATLQQELSQVHAEVRWEPAEKLHITLKFLGNTEQEVLEGIDQELRRELHALSLAPLELSYNTLGVFPNPSSARIIWVGSEPTPTLLTLFSVVERVCERRGFPRENRPFHPHLTIGRVKGKRNLANLTDKLKTITFEPVKSLCTQILIMQSQLHPAGSRYSVLKTIPLI